MMTGLVKLACAFAAVAIPMAAGALATLARTPEVQLAVVTVGGGLGLVCLFTFADADRREA